MKLTKPATSSWQSVSTRGRILWLKSRRMALHVAGLGLVSAAAWDVSRPLGLLAGGVSCIIIEALTRGHAE